MWPIRALAIGLWTEIAFHERVQAALQGGDPQSRGRMRRGDQERREGAGSRAIKLRNPPLKSGLSVCSQRPRRDPEPPPSPAPGTVTLAEFRMACAAKPDMAPSEDAIRTCIRLSKGTHISTKGKNQGNGQLQANVCIRE